MNDPAATSPGSLMPGYPWMTRAKLDASHVEGKVITLRRLGVPYPQGYEARAAQDMRAQAEKIAEGLRKGGIDVEADREIVAMIAYLQRLGTDIKKPVADVQTAGAAGAGTGGTVGTVGTR